MPVICANCGVEYDPPETKFYGRFCSKCGGHALCEVVTSDDGAHDDDRYECQSCRSIWWVDGADA